MACKAFHDMSHLSTHHWLSPFSPQSLHDPLAFIYAVPTAHHAAPSHSASTKLPHFSPRAGSQVPAPRSPSHCLMKVDHPHLVLPLFLRGLSCSHNPFTQGELLEDTHQCPEQHSSSAQWEPSEG